MKKFPIIAAAVAIALIPLSAFAGVVIIQEQTATTPSGERKNEQTIMIQGNKQKIVTKSRQMITDLDKNAMFLVDPATSTYIQVNFPLSGPMARAVAHAASTDFQKGTTTRKILGYSCTDYVGKGQSMGGEYTVTECFSSDAPGAKEFNAFQKAMAEKIKNAAPKNNTPEGIPLALDSTVQMNTMRLPQGGSPEEQKKLQQQMANAKPVTVTTKTVVTDVESKTLPADTFDIPKGYTQRQMPHISLVPKPGAAAPGASAGAAAPSAGASGWAPPPPSPAQ